MAFSNPEIIAVLNKIKPPYNVNTLSINAALEVLSSNERIQLQVSKIKQERELMIKQLMQLEIVKLVYPSDTNFLLVKFLNEELVFKTLLKNGIVVRNRASQIENALRITIGTKSENEQLINLLKEI
ncbi:MAG: histidinol-phosphate aminotransferase [Flavobacteriales bacterium]|jgi:histidinol-phosphate aminotransferase